MEICFHAGLHKSGTTTVQHAFSRAFGESGRVWYPGLGHHSHFDHQPLIWPFLQSARSNPFYDSMVNDRVGGPATLQDAIEIAASSGVEKLIMSCETLDTMVDADVESLRSACRGHSVRAVFTVTPPLHRWASWWQQLVRNGFGAAPAPSYELFAEAALLEPGGLEGLVTRFPADTKVVRLVSRSAIDADLARSVAELMELDSEVSSSTEAYNESIGDSIVLLAYLNSRGITNGLFSARDREIFDERLAEAGSDRIDDFSAADFEVPRVVLDVAESERSFLERGDGTGSMVVADPGGELPRWGDVGLPDWYVRAAETSSGPGGMLQDPEAIRAQWSAALRMYSYEATLGRVGLVRDQLDAQLRDTRFQLDTTGETLRATRQELRAIRRSRTWRWATAAAQVGTPVLRVLRVRR